MPISSLKEKTVSGVTWTAIDQFSNQGIQFIIAILIARVLSPTDYGVIAIVMIFTNIVSVFVGSGFGTALIQRRDISREECSSVFFFNMGMSLLFYGGLYLCAPYIARFFAMPPLTPVLRVLGLIVITNAVSMIQVTLLNRDIDFKKQALVNLSSFAVSGAFGLYLAYTGYGVWALVGQTLSRSVAMAVIYWAATSWRPLMRCALRDLRGLWGYSSKLLASGLLDSIFSNLQPFLIGKFYTAADLGFYSQGRRFPALLAPNITMVVQRVTFPALATIQDDTERLRAAYRKVIMVVMFVIFPVMLTLAVVAAPFVELILTAKWLPAVPYLQVICLAMMLYPLHAINLNICMVKGRTDLFLKLEIIKKVIGVALVAAAIPFGVFAIAASELVHSIVCLYFNLKYNGDLIGYSFTAQIKDIASTFTLALTAAALAGSISLLTISSLWFLLPLQVLVAIGTYLLLCRFFKLSAYAEVRAIATERMGRMFSR